uniref:Uncharacterized protein n=1 Tax=Aegilops tauschii subsp. strangulata TaxID=200361 RepID=A0A453MQY1_AEGTS
MLCDPHLLLWSKISSLEAPSHKLVFYLVNISSKIHALPGVRNPSRGIAYNTDVPCVLMSMNLRERNSTL